MKPRLGYALQRPLPSRVQEAYGLRDGIHQVDGHAIGHENGEWDARRWR